ncbi:hypothetical protein SMKI_16G0360 [Saccharomyces mikatae IFO 1815]|uniref:Kel2p n=1 Tax=Saccharomyces mikatae IFO 1815 TaxID=226126 RepID=A0AA35NFB2_SACMI|nr:uncharacterized protein SMKI_16G0360 [Saccharomyces mikatae IFO 1815]CAI4036722.1 hypothetical protein SMKI_16G0360 [Saccharomyces mikatae IFO 1815]
MSVQTVPRAMPLMDKQNSTRIVTPTLPPNQHRNISGASTNLPSPLERKNSRRYIWNRIKLKDSPFPRYRHSSSFITTNDNRIFVTGGLYDQSVYGDVWEITANANGTSFTSKRIQIDHNTPPPRVGHASTMCGNAYVVFGGDTHKLNKNRLLDDDLYLFNINSYKWTIPHPIGSRPLGRYGHKISIIASKQMHTELYLFGGQIDETYFNDLAVFDLSSFRRPNSHWEFLEPISALPPPLTNHTMVTFDNKLWVFGGETPKTISNDTYCYDPIQNAWSKVETTGEKPPPVQEHASVVYKHLMCVFGGKDIHNTYSNDVYFLNLLSLKWFKLPCVKEGIPQERSGHSLTLMNNEKLVIMGGDKFDYASSNILDMHTSEVDQGGGTLLYTLDLSSLDELCPGIMSESLLVQGNVRTIPSWNSETSNTVENENQEMINILTPKLPNTKTAFTNDIDEEPRDYTSSFDDKTLPYQNNTTEKTPQSSKSGKTTDNKFATNEKRPEAGIEVTNGNLTLPQGLAIYEEEYTRPSVGDSSSDKVIPKTLYDDLSLHIKTLHLEAQQKELETARHISELEKELQRLTVIKEASKDSNFQMARLKNLEIQKTFLKSRINDLENLITVKLSQVNEIRGKITVQNIKLKTDFEGVNIKKDIVDLENKCDVLKRQNEILVSKMQKENPKLLTCLEDSSHRLNKLLKMYSASIQLSSHKKNEIYEKEPLIKIEKIVNEMHETARIKEELQLEAQKVYNERDILQAGLVDKSNKLDALKKISAGSSKSMSLTKKAIDLSRSELEKYHKCNNTLQQEIERIRSEQEIQDKKQGNKQEQHNTTTYNNLEALHRMKVNNLKAELYISKGDRDSLKDELLVLKKRLYTLKQAQQPQ